MGDLLRAVRVLGPVLRLMGRYRAATVVSLVLAVGWLVVGLDGRSDAATGADRYAYAPGPFDRADLIAESQPDIWRIALDHYGVAYLGAFGVGILGAVALFGFLLYSHSVRRGTHRGPGGAPDWSAVRRVSSDAPGGGSHRG